MATKSTSHASKRGSPLGRNNSSDASVEQAGNPVIQFARLHNEQRREKNDQLAFFDTVKSLCQKYYPLQVAIHNFWPNRDL